jgi:hypothetical protein
MTHEISRLKLDCPLWRIWSSDAGHLYATRSRMNAYPPGEAVTVGAKTPDGLRQAIGVAEREHARMVRHREAHG